MQTTEAMKLRKSTRDFTDRQISNEDVKKIVQAALYAPVGMKKFSELKITVIQNKALLARIDRECRRDPSVSPLHNVPTLILVSSSTENEALANQNVACLVDHMLLAATDLGLANLYIKGVCPFLSKNEALLRELNIPEGFTPLASAAVGYAFIEPEKREKPLNEVTVVEYIQ